MDVLVAFRENTRYPEPLRFKLREDGEEKTVSVGRILDVQDIGAGGMARLEYKCASPGTRGEIRYKLMYYYNKGTWGLERSK